MAARPTLGEVQPLFQKGEKEKKAASSQGYDQNKAASSYGYDPNNPSYMSTGAGSSQATADNCEAPTLLIRRECRRRRSSLGEVWI